jgi:glycosyltransferase involved in cell wall biosynthesis|nr:glycosyltransferase [uncultured Psychroserpens sp.]
MLKSSPLVTIILPVYNGEKTLKATIESVINQTYSNFELLICIDGTKDGSKAIAEAFSESRITVFENAKNLGLGPNVNKLISLSSPKSEYIAMAEQDDIYVKTRIEKQVAVMQEHSDVGLVSGIAEFVSDSGSLLFPDILVIGKQFPQEKSLFKYLYKNQLKVVNTCMMIRKQVHVDNGLVFTDVYPNMNVDWDYVLRFSLVSNVYGIPEKLVIMNRKGSNESVTTNKKVQHETSRLLLQDFRNEFPNLISQSDYKEALKFHRKIELGHHSKLGILVYSISYFLLYFDLYFLKYPLMRIKKYFNKR